VSDQVQRLLDRLEAVWAALTESYAGVPESTLVEPGVVDDWSVKDVLAHVTTWEEAPRHLPLIIAGGTPPRVCGAGRHRRLQRPRHRGRAAPVPGGGPAPAGRAPTRLLEFIRSQPEGTSRGRHGRDAACGWTPTAITPEHTAAIKAWRARLPA
jgi:hypothetical protein